MQYTKYVTRELHKLIKVDWSFFMTRYLTRIQRVELLLDCYLYENESLSAIYKSDFKLLIGTYTQVEDWTKLCNILAHRGYIRPVAKGESTILLLRERKDLFFFPKKLQEVRSVSFKMT